MYDLDQLKSFVILSEELHFGRAAWRLNMTQSPLSRKIQQLERVMGVALFNRSSRSVSLTQAGVFFYPEAKRIIRLTETATDLARRVASGFEGSISVGFTATAAFDSLPQLVSLCMQRLPTVHLALKEFTTQQQLDALENGEIDLAFVRPLLGLPPLPSMLVSSEPLVLAMRDNHPLAQCSELTFGDLDRCAFIGYSFDSRYFSSLIDAHLLANSVRPVLVQQIGHIHSILPLVSYGVGVALVPRSASRLGVSGVVFRDIKSLLDKPVELHIVWREEGKKIPLLNRVIEVARSIRDISIPPSTGAAAEG